ncbi:MAG: hypothetical protein IJR77_08075 [Bacteroidales bacterium]|nr:hypothetical protein [Bacteroidales bacterium]
MKRVLVLLLTSCLLGSCSNKYLDVIRYQDYERVESLGVYKQYCVLEYYWPYRNESDKEGDVPAHYKILLPTGTDLKKKIFGPNENRCFLYTGKRGIAIFQDLSRAEEKKCEGQLSQISKEEAERRLHVFEGYLEKKIKVKEKRMHYMYEKEQVIVVMFNLSEKDYHDFIELPTKNLRIKARGVCKASAARDSSLSM